ncbi:MAG: two-component system response regulator [Mariprofundus sp.]|nr:two-component system response regulator [Mariprofundus sp.]
MNNYHTKDTILIVDDEPLNLKVLNTMLSEHYLVSVATNGIKALEICFSQTPPDLLLLDIMMPDMNGYEVCRKLKSNQKTRHIPIIFVTAKGMVEDESAGFDAGAADYLTKPVNARIVNARVKTHLTLYHLNQELERKVQDRTQELHQSRLDIIQRLGRAAEFKDNETGMHIIRMSHYSRCLGLATGMNEQQADLLFNASPMHDIGKIGIPDHILKKQGKLTDEEFSFIKKHPEMGATIIGESSAELLQAAKLIALTHHEKWNGTGYPHGLAGEKIPLMGRIVAITDVFDALTSVRPYKDAWPIEDTIALIRNESGKHFDANLVELFISILPQILDIKKMHQESEANDTPYW